MFADEPFREGYAAGWEFHMGSGARAENPYAPGTDDYDDWKDGFDEAGQDS